MMNVWNGSNSASTRSQDGKNVIGTSSPDRKFDAIRAIALIPAMSAIQKAAAFRMKRNAKLTTTPSATLTANSSQRTGGEGSTRSYSSAPTRNVGTNRVSTWQ